MSDEQPYTWVMFERREFVVVPMGRYGNLGLIRDVWFIEGPKTKADNDERFEETKE